MAAFNRKDHWNSVYETKNTHEVGWYQPDPTTSLEFLNGFKLPKTAKIIDIGGGDSFLVDRLMDMGYQDITVLDISAKAIEKAKKRLGNDSVKVSWIVADAADFQPKGKYDFWHDRAALHFLNDEKEIEGYFNTLTSSLNPGACVLIGTFSEIGPEKCSGLTVRKYSEENLCSRLSEKFEKIKCITLDHETPSGSKQNFLFCSFRKINL